MTSEAIKYFKFIRKILCEDHLKICPKDSIAYQATLKEKEFYDMAIKALEQEPILDEIRAEIASLSNANPSYWHSGDMVEREEVLEIIDKYKAESEEE